MRARLTLCVLGTLVSALTAHHAFQAESTTDVGIMFAFLSGVFAGFTFITWQDERIKSCR